MFIEIEKREINPKFVVEITKPKPYIEYKEKPVGMDTITVPIDTGRFVFSLIILGTEAINIFNDNKENLEKERESLSKKLNKLI